MANSVDLDGSPLFAKVSVLVCRAESVKASFSCLQQTVAAWQGRIHTGFAFQNQPNATLENVATQTLAESIELLSRDYSTPRKK